MPSDYLARIYCVVQVRRVPFHMPEMWKGIITNQFVKGVMNCCQIDSANLPHLMIPWPIRVLAFLLARNIIFRVYFDHRPL